MIICVLAEDSESCEADLKDMRSSFMNGLTPSTSCMAYVVIPCNLPENSRTRGFQGSQLQEEEETPHDNEAERVRNLYAPDVLSTSELRCQPLSSNESPTTPDGDDSDLEPSKRRTKDTQSKHYNTEFNVPDSPPSPASDSASRLANQRSTAPTQSRSIVGALPPGRCPTVETSLSSVEDSGETH